MAEEHVTEHYEEQYYGEGAVEQQYVDPTTQRISDDVISVYHMADSIKQAQDAQTATVRRGSGRGGNV